MLHEDNPGTASRGRVASLSSLLLLSALASASGAPPAAASGMAVHQIGELRDVQQVVVSPDGRQVAYVLRVPRTPLEDENGKWWSELHLVDAAGTSRPYVSGQVDVSNVAWTPDGKGISYLAKRGVDEQPALYVIPVDGGESRRMLGHDAEIKEYDWSPDGKRVAFVAKPIQDEQLEELKTKGFDQEVFEEDGQPDTVWVAGVGAGAGEPRALELGGSPSAVRWSPAGDRLLVAVAPTALIDDHYMRRRLRVVDPESGKILARIDNAGKLGDVEFSPDGQRIALIAGADGNDPREGRLMVAPVEGGQPRDLLPSYPGHVQSFAWQDRHSLVYVGDVGTETTVGKVDFLGERSFTLVPKGGTVLGSVSISGDGKVAAFRGETAEHPTEVFRMELGPDTGEPRRMTNSNPWLADVALAPQEVVSFQARDGLQLEGILVRPLDAKPGKRYPLVMIVHGGPESHHRNGWQTSYSRPAQVLAANGFAVFLTNYRGSTGRGVEFSKLSQGDFAGKEFDDLVDAVDHLVASGLVDKDRVGITGGSYGGYATAWASTYYSERFAAGVMSVGISDLLSKVGTSDIPNELYQVHMRKHPWDDWQLMLERSPVFHAKKARTPLLILHGRKDTRVFPGQSLELYRYLKILNQAPVRLVLYPEEGHGNKKAPARFDYTLRLLRWMEHYLKGPGGDPPAYALDYEQAAGRPEAGGGSTGGLPSR